MKNDKCPYCNDSIPFEKCDKVTFKTHLDEHCGESLKEAKANMEKIYPHREKLLEIDCIEYQDGLILYDLIYTDDEGNKTSEGLFDEVEVIAKLLYHMQVIDKDPRLLMRQSRKSI